MKHPIRVFATVLASVLLLPALAGCTGKPTTPDDTTASIGDTTAFDAPTEAPETQPVTEPETEAETEPPAPLYEPPTETALSPANVAIGVPVITNACEGGSNQKLTDGDLSTSYTTGLLSKADRRTYPYEVVIDLTRSYPLCGLVIHRATTGSLFDKEAIFDKFRVEGSEDGLTYTEIATEAGAEVTDAGIRLTLDTTARFVRITSLDLGDRTNYGLNLAEVEVLSTITTRDNLLPSKRALAMQPGAVDVLTATYRLPDEAAGEISFVSDNPAVVTVDAATGAVTAIADGEATLYVTDGKNATPIPVTVKTRDPEYRVSTFYLADHGLNTREVFALLKESGITFIENCRPYDTYGNDTTEYLRVMAADFGLTLSIADPAHSRYLSMSDEEIRAIAAKYKNLPGYGGLYLVDEPLDPVPYARVYRAIIAEDPFCQPHLNLFPPFGQISDYHGYVTDWIATTGGDVLASLSYDNYPYGPSANTFHEWVYDSMNELRRCALLYDDLNTGYYIHSMGIHGAYRVPTDSEILYHTALGVAYGFKDFKHFVWFTPPYSGSGEHFITGILNPEMGKSEIYEGVKAANTMLHTLSPILGNTDAVEVYRYQGRGTSGIPDAFFVGLSGRNPAMLSVLVDRTTGQQYLVVVNSQLNRKSELKLAIRDAALTEFVEITTGEAQTVAVKDGVLTVSLAAGSLAVFKLPEGYDARVDRSVNDGTSESLLSGIGASVSSSKSGTTYAYMLNDGNQNGTGWSSVASDTTPWIVYDLKTLKTFNRIDIHPMSSYQPLYPGALTVSVSDDGITYRDVVSVQNIDYKQLKALTFETTTARFVRITIDEVRTFGQLTGVYIGEIELYMDNGQVPAMPTYGSSAGTITPNDTVLSPSEAGVVAVSYDAFMIDGEMQINGGADAWLNDRDNTVDATGRVKFYGWVGFSQAIEAFGYVIDDGEPVWNQSFATYTEDAVRSAGGQNASRFEITADLSALSGKHTVRFLVKLTDGNHVLLHQPLTVNLP